LQSSKLAPVIGHDVPLTHGPVTVAFDAHDQFAASDGDDEL
jgi:hypothetical protein